MPVPVPLLAGPLSPRFLSHCLLSRSSHRPTFLLFPCPTACCPAVPLSPPAVQAMSAIDDDATVTQLASAWVGVALGGAKVQEASYIYQELGDKFNWTVREQGQQDWGGLGGYLTRAFIWRASVCH